MDHAAAEPQSREQSLTRGSRAVYWGTILLGAATLAVAAVLTFVDLGVPGLHPRSPHPEGASIPIAAAAFTVAFLAVERLGFLFFWRGHRLQTSLDEVVLFLGFAFLPLPHVVLGVAVGAVGNQILRRRSLRKGTFNVAMYAVAGALAAIAVGALRDVGAPVPWPSLAAPAVFVMTTSSLLALLLSRLDGARWFPTWWDRLATWAFASATIGASMGLVIYALWEFHPVAPILALPLAFYLHRFGQLSEWADKELHAHRHLADVSRTVAGSSDLDDVAERVLAACRELFQCGEAQLTLNTGDGAPARAWRRAFDGGGAATGGITSSVMGPNGERIGELSVFPRFGQRPFGERESNLLSAVAGSASAAAGNARALRVVEEAVRSIMASERRYRDLFDTANVFIHVLDAQMRMVDVNPSAVEGLGWSREAMSGRGFTDLVAASDQGPSRSALRHLEEQGEVKGFECQFVTRSGRVVQVLLDARALHPDEKRGGPGRYVLVSRDITSLKTLEDDLRHALAEREETIHRLENLNRELEEFTLWVTHDLREPLRGVSTIAQFLAEDVDGLSKAEVKDFATRIADASERLKERVKALHAFSRIVQRDEAFADVDLQQVVETVIDGLQPRIRERNAVVRFPDGALPVVRAQPHRIDLVFANLVENALKYANAERSVVEIGFTMAPHEWRFHVRDNGPGIPQEYHDRVFQLFQRGPGAEREAGTGAGLTIVKRIVEQHGGHVWLESETRPPLNGTTFRFSIPRDPDPEHEEDSSGSVTVTAHAKQTDATPR